MERTKDGDEEVNESEKVEEKMKMLKKASSDEENGQEKLRSKDWMHR